MNFPAAARESVWGRTQQSTFYKQPLVNFHVQNISVWCLMGYTLRFALLENHGTLKAQLGITEKECSY